MKFSNELKKSLNTAQDNYIKAKAENQVIEEIAKECKLKILNENEFFQCDESGIKTDKRILKETRDFMMRDSDFKNYCKLVYNEYIKRGLEVPNYNTTANYISLPKLIKAEKELFEIGISIIPEENRKYLRRAFNIITKRDEILKLMNQLKLA